VKQLIHGSLNGIRIRQSLPHPYISRRGMQIPWKDQGDVREENVVGNACGGKSGSHGSKAVLLSHM